MLNKHHVAGTNKKHKVMVYALSTCPWCAKAKALLGEIGAEYDYIDVDLLPEGVQDKVMQEVEAVNPAGGFPTIVIGDNCIVGFKPEEIKTALS